ncbi:unnamed protein product [Didymodactylos carnosus]|uniref:Uncharacterized protein n=1 Tax=Didymodactylos carnosus TaxID=1234261 RepID=A0A814QXG4_9BILA|nr:unnamed protein product [Didymodactylos carnosus]CAF3888557.1 unnamed protein product [Didymodactylos carnosus]
MSFELASINAGGLHMLGIRGKPIMSDILSNLANQEISLAINETKLLFEINQYTIRQLNKEEFLPLKGLSISMFRQVWLAHSRKDGRIYVIKRIFKKFYEQWKKQKIYHREVRMLAAFKNPFIVSVFGTFDFGPYQYICYEYLGGGTLNHLLEERLRLDEEMSQHISAQIILAFQYLHGLDIAYRNLNPDTVVFDRHGYVRLIDFQLTRVIQPHTHAQTIKGDIFYCPPEVILRLGHSLPVDWWSLGTLIYEMIAGYSPFFQNEGHMTLRAAANGQYRRFPSHFSESVKDLLRSLLEQHPTRRLGSQGGDAEEIKEHLWFLGFNWNDIYSKDPRKALYRPRLKNDNDTTHFDLPNQKLFDTF